MANEIEALEMRLERTEATLRQLIHWLVTELGQHNVQTLLNKLGEPHA